MKNNSSGSEISEILSQEGHIEDAKYLESEEIDLFMLWNIIWKSKFFIIVTTILFGLASVVFALFTPNEYKATALLSPASNSSSSSLSKLAGQFGGLASLAGIDLGGAGEDSKTTIAMEIIKTWGFLEEFINENDIEVDVYASKGWNRSSGELIIDDDIYDVESNKWVRNFDPSKGETAEPSSWELYEEIHERISISRNKESGLISLSVEFYSPILAKEWVDLLVDSVNHRIQEQDRNEAIKNINYLNERIKETNLSDMQSVFYQLIEEQTKSLMLAEVSDEYVFKTISPAKIPEEKSKPKRALIVIFGVLLGGFIAIIIVLVRHVSTANQT